jgi:hypothetical protein
LPKLSAVVLGDARGTPRPVPLRDTVWVEPAVPPALSVKVRVAALAPVALGVKLTVMEQLPPAATEPLQLFVSLKSPVFVPVMAMLLMVSVPVPEFDRVNAGLLTVVFTGVLLKTSLVVDKVACGVPVPVPFSETVCVEPATPLALSVTTRLPDREPVDCGVNVTLIVHDELAATEVPQLLVCPKFPDVAMLAILNGPVPPLVSDTVIAVLVVPTVWLGNVSAV